MTNSTVCNYQLLTLIFVCTGIHYNQRFVLFNKFQFFKFSANQVIIQESSNLLKPIYLKYLKETPNHGMISL